MPRHRNRQHATHELTCVRETIEDPGYDEDPIVTEDTIVEDEPVEYDSGGTSFVRAGGSERVERMPTVTGRGGLAHVLEEGDTVDLASLDPDGADLSGLEIRGIDADYSRRARAARATIELEQH